MDLSEAKIQQITRKLLLARMRLLSSNGFYGLLLMHIKLGLDKTIEKAAMDSARIVFNPEFVDRLTDEEIDYCLLHMVIHIAMKHCDRKGNYKDEKYWEAADIVTNSLILDSYGGDMSRIFLSESGGIQPHLCPDDSRGSEHTVEEVCRMLKVQVELEKGKEKQAKMIGIVGEGNGNSEDNESLDNSTGWDNHDRLANENKQMNDSERMLNDIKWQSHIQNAAEAMEDRSWATTSKGRGLVPGFAERFLEELRKPQNDWRALLTDFIQEEVCDYSFTPPDRRYDGDFFLPDYNDKDIEVKKILFMIDTSGSMSTKDITDCYSEIKGAIDQFNGRIEGWLGFFDATIVEPKPFEDEESFSIIRPKGGGGTSFDIIFKYVNEKMNDDPPVSIVILTDGMAPFPDERVTNDIPTLWIINNEMITPPWGRVARIEADNVLNRINSTFPKSVTSTISGLLSGTLSPKDISFEALKGLQ